MLLNNERLSTSEEHKIDERIRISYLRNGGRLLDVIKELHDLPQEHILKVLEKFKKESKRGVTNLIADRILEHILFGYTSRTTILFDTLKKLEVEELQVVSTCHRSPVRKMELGEENTVETVKYECVQCGELCDILTSLDDDKISLKISTIDQLRKEDAHLGKLVEALGYTKVEKQEVPQQVTKVTTIVVSGGKQADPSVVRNLEKLDPVEQESLRISIESQIQEAELVSGISTEQSK